MTRISITVSALVACATGAAAGCATDPDDFEVDENGVALEPFHGRFGSPSIVRDGDMLHAYFPIQQFQGNPVHVAHARSSDGGAHWSRVGDALPRLGARAIQRGSVWAPGAAKIEDGRWMLYYTAVLAGTDQHMCTYRAHADSPRGPFVDDYAEPLICPDGGLWAIDPYPVEDARGDWHLLARIDERGGVNTISLRQLGVHGEHFAPDSKWERLTAITKGSWEEPVMENAAMVRLPSPNGEQRWYVFYSGNSYRTDKYAVGYADCGTSIHGPCVKRTADHPWLESRPDIHMFGPGTPTFYRDEHGDTIMAVNTWKFAGGQANPKNNGQVMHMFEVHINASGRPVAKFIRMVE